ncbi:MAG: hypothetical protein Q4F95_01235 [Oscillospiraceae bacterium]|nr:hypothetical protein [Oscillospiraceae bacterium]
MNLLKRISVILPVLAVSFFVFTLAVVNKQKNEEKEAAVTVFTDSYVSSARTQKSENSSTASVTVSETPVSTSIVTQTQAPVTAQAKAPAAKTTHISQPSVTAVVITPYSKKPVAEPPATLEPEPVETPYEIVLESITLVCPETSSETHTTQDSVSETTSDSSQTSSEKQTENTTIYETYGTYQVVFFK